MMTLDRLNAPLVVRAQSSAFEEDMSRVRCSYCGVLGHTSHCSCGRPDPCLECNRHNESAFRREYLGQFPERRAMVQVPDQIGNAFIHDILPDAITDLETLARLERAHIEHVTKMVMKPHHFEQLQNLLRAGVITGEEALRVIHGDGPPPQTIALADPTNFEAGNKVQVYSTANCPVDTAFLLSEPSSLLPEPTDAFEGRVHQYYLAPNPSWSVAIKL